MKRERERQQPWCARDGLFGHGGGFIKINKKKFFNLSVCTFLRLYPVNNNNVRDNTLY